MLKTFSGRRASQNERELRAFIALLRERGVNRYLEIGAREGDTFHEVMLALPDGAEGVAVDLPGGLWGKGTTADGLKRAVADLNARRRNCAAILGASTSEPVRHQVDLCAPFDAILIDGDHTYDGVKADWEAFRGMAPIIAFHDIVGDGEREKVSGCAVEVPRLWAEIKASGLQTMEFVDQGSRMGIGLVLQ